MYLDPGFGGMLVQVLIAIAAVGGGILFSLRRKIRSLFSKEDEEVRRHVQQGIEDDVLDTLSEDG